MAHSYLSNEEGKIVTTWRNSFHIQHTKNISLVLQMNLIEFDHAGTWKRVPCNAACSMRCPPPLHCQHLHTGNLERYQDDLGNTFLYPEPCVGDLSGGE